MRIAAAVIAALVLALPAAAADRIKAPVAPDQATHGQVTHGLAMHGQPKYPAGFDHFDYVNPTAPKGGEMRLAALNTFDNLNPFIVKGVEAAGSTLPFETLMTPSADEPFSTYGLIAESVELPADRSWVAFTLRKEARWHDG